MSLLRTSANMPSIIIRPRAIMGLLGWQALREKVAVFTPTGVWPLPSSPESYTKLRLHAVYEQGVCFTFLVMPRRSTLLCGTLARRRQAFSLKSSRCFVMLRLLRVGRCSVLDRGCGQKLLSSTVVRRLSTRGCERQPA